MINMLIFVALNVEDVSGKRLQLMILMARYEHMCFIMKNTDGRKEDKNVNIVFSLGAFRHPFTEVRLECGLPCVFSTHQT